MLAVARWWSGNHRAASLVGAKTMRGWAKAPRVCPNITIGYWILKLSPGSVPRNRSTAPSMFSQAPRISCDSQRAEGWKFTRKSFISGSEITVRQFQKVFSKISPRQWEVFIFKKVQLISDSQSKTSLHGVVRSRWDRMSCGWSDKYKW